MSVDEAHFLELCKTQIENKLQWGPVAHWHNEEFEDLSADILDKTGISLSHTTLKRLWGRVKYDHLPTTTTLNALASYLGYENWRGFKQSSDPKKSRRTDPASKAKKRTVRLRWIVLPALASVLVIWLFVTTREVTVYDNSSMEFSGKYVSKGLPNTVIFSFDVSKIDGKEFFIQQSWDKTKRVSISPDQQNASTTYYLPGYFDAKLIADEVVLKETGIFIETEGWMATVNREPVPEYVLEKDFIRTGGTMKLSDDKFETLSGLPDTFIQGFHYYSRSFDIGGDAFTLEASVKNGFQSGTAMCGFTNIIMQFTDGVIILPLSIPGCVGELSLLLFDQYFDGKKEDLSAFGCEISGWQKVKLKSGDKKVVIHINDRLVREVTFHDDPGKLAGMRFNFLGAGEVDYVRLLDDAGSLVFNENFD